MTKTHHFQRGAPPLGSEQQGPGAPDPARQLWATQDGRSGEQPAQEELPLKMIIRTRLVCQCAKLKDQESSKRGEKKSTQKNQERPSRAGTQQRASPSGNGTEVLPAKLTARGKTQWLRVQEPHWETPSEHLVEWGAQSQGGGVSGAERRAAPYSSAATRVVLLDHRDWEQWQS